MRRMKEGLLLMVSCKSSVIPMETPDVSDLLFPPAVVEPVLVFVCAGLGVALELPSEGTLQSPAHCACTAAVV